MSPQGKDDAYVKRLRQLAAIWNDTKSYPTNYDIERAMGIKIKSVQTRVRRYTKHRLANPELGLKELVWRRAVTGGLIGVPEAVIRQLDEYRFDVDVLKGAKGIIVTSAQFGAELNKHFWASLQHYAEFKDFPLLVLPIKYGPVKTVKGRLTALFAPELMGHMVFEDTDLCKDNLMLNVTRMRPTLVRFLTDSVCQMGKRKSQIMAAPKLELEHRPRLQHNHPKAIMTTGACTIPNYTVDNIGQQDRTAEIATAEHQYAAIIVEFAKGGAFHFRQLHATKRGEFYDINPKGGASYISPNGVEHRPDDVSALVLGDWHTGLTDERVRRGTFCKGGMVPVLNPDDVVLHDFVDCHSVSHHDVHYASRRAYKAQIGEDSLEWEMDEAVAELRWMVKHTKGRINVTSSNHPEFITRYIDEMHWRNDDINLEIGARMLLAMIEDMKARKPPRFYTRPADPVISWLRKHCPSVNLVEREEALMLPRDSKRQILCSVHGDIGPTGGQTRSTQSFRKLNQSVIIGHNHSAQIWGPIWRVGVSTPRTQHYVRGPKTAWTNTHCVIFKNGRRQLLSFVRNTWHA